VGRGGAGQPVAAVKLAVQNGGGGVEPAQAFGDQRGVGRADAVATFGAKFELHHVAGADEVFLAPADPADHVGLVPALPPEVGACQLRQAAGDGVGFPERLAILDQDRDALVRVKLQEAVGVVGVEGRRPLQRHWRVQVAGHGNRKARVRVPGVVKRGGHRAPVGGIGRKMTAPARQSHGLSVRVGACPDPERTGADSRPGQPPRTADCQGDGCPGDTIYPRPQGKAASLLR
jgi:hypothetical protein